MAAESEAKKRRTDQEEEKPFNASFDFTNAQVLDPRLTWNNAPASYDLVEGTGLVVTPKPKTDYWCRTYHTPPSDRTSGHSLLYSLPATELKEVSAETTFTLEHKIQFDQAGLMVLVDGRHWLKAGIEIEDGCPNISCVTTNTESDWSYKQWPTAENIRIRVKMSFYPQLVEYKVEYADDKGVWCFLREGPLFLPSEGAEVKVGVMCCAPKKEEDDNDGMKVTFKSLEINGQ